MSTSESPSGVPNQSAEYVGSAIPRERRDEWRAEAHLRGGVPHPTDPDPHVRYASNRIVSLLDALDAAEADRGPSPCEQDDHDSVWQAGREAGYRDALIALAEHRDGTFFDELDRAIADSLRKDREYAVHHDASVLRSVATLLDLEAEENYAGGADVDAGTYQAAARIVRGEADHLVAGTSKRPGERL